MRKLIVFLLCLGLFVSVIPGVSAQQTDWLGEPSARQTDWQEELNAQRPNWLSCVSGQLQATPQVSVINNVVNATITFTNVPKPAVCTLRWYIGDTLCAEDFEFRLDNGATSSLACSIHFNEETQFRTPVWVELSYENQRRVFSVTTQVMPIPEPPEEPGPNYYQVHVIRNKRTIIVYERDENGNYTVVSNVFACSPGMFNYTPTGSYRCGGHWKWQGLMGNVAGQYSTHIWGDFLFHSVPCYDFEPDTLKWQEYNKLGDFASAGCVRLSVIDAKWIYDHIPRYTTVRIYDSNTMPVDKPVGIKINGDSPNRGWDPTDPLENNPTKAAEIPEVAEIPIRQTPPREPLWKQVG